jgi:hypothetical protein
MPPDAFATSVIQILRVNPEAFGKLPPTFMKAVNGMVVPGQVAQVAPAALAGVNWDQVTKLVQQRGPWPQDAEPAKAR